MAGDIETKYGSSAQYTLSLNSLATSSSLTTGRESTEVVNTTTLALDYLVGGQVKAGTTPTTGNTIQLWVWGNISDTPKRPDLGAGTALTGVDAAATWSSSDIRNAACLTFGAITNDGTTGRIYTFGVRGIARLFGSVPKRHGLFFAHSTAVNLDASAGGEFHYTPVLAQYT